MIYKRALIKYWFQFVLISLTNWQTNLFLKNGPNPASFWFIFRSFSQHKDKYRTNFTINDKSIDGVLGSRTRGGMMEGVDWAMAAPPIDYIILLLLKYSFFYRFNKINQIVM